MQTITRQPAPHQSGSQAATIRLQDLELVLATVKAKRSISRDLAWFCALSEHPTISVDCGSNPRIHQDLLESAKRYGLSRARVQPMRRGHIAKLFERTRWLRGMPEVRKTWRTGIRALLTENKYTLQGGAA